MTASETGAESKLEARSLPEGELWQQVSRGAAFSNELRIMWMLQYEEELTVGIGISTGYVTVGNIGSENGSSTP